MSGRFLRVALFLIACLPLQALAVSPPCPTISIAPATTLPSGTAGVSYGPTTFAASGSAATPYTYDISSGLPSGSGLSIGPSTGILSGTPLQAGSFIMTVTATDSNGCTGGRSYALDVAVGNQTINFTSTAPGSATVGGPTYTATATATSGLPVTLTIDASAASVCSISGSTVSFTSVGTCVIDANQAGNASFNAAPQVQQSFAVGIGSQNITFTSTPPSSPTVGGPTYTVTATGGGSGNPVMFTIDATATSVCSISGATVSFVTTGTCVIDANQAGNANYNAAPQAIQSFAIGKGSQTITFTSTAPASATVGGTTYNVTATATSGLPVTFTIDATAASICSISGSTVSFIAVGTCVVDANQAGDTNWNAAPQAQQSFAVGKGSQTISFTSTAPAGATVGGPTYNVTATATSGLPVTFTIDVSAASICSITGSMVSFAAVGTCVIDANQAGNANYTAAAQVQQSFAVGQGSQTINFTSTAPSGAAVGGPTYNVTATATSGLPVTLTIDVSAASVCSLSGSTVSFVGNGTCVIDANQAGNANYTAAPQAQQSFAVGQGSQTIVFTSTPLAAKVGGPTYNVTATGGASGNPVVFTIDAVASSICSISGNTVSFTAVGTCVIDANQAGNANYMAALQTQQSFAVAMGDQTITFTSTAPAATVGGPTYNVTATATSGLTVTFSIDSTATSICSINTSTNTVSFTAVGTCVIDADQAGDANWNPAPQAQQSVTVSQGSQTISFTSTAPANAKVGGPTYSVTATATSGLPVTFSLDGTSTGCSLAGNTVSFTAVGTCKIDANQAGNANYMPAPQAQQTLAVAKGDQTITFTSTAPNNAQVNGATYNVTATATSGLAVTITIDASAASVCSIAGSTVSFIGAGTCVIDANQAGNTNYNAAPQQQQSFAVAKGDQTISFSSSAPVGAKVSGPTYIVTATATSGLAVTITIDATATSVCSIAGSTVSFIGAGTCVIDANQAGNASYNAAPQAQQSFAVAKGDQTISFSSSAPVGAKVNGPTYTVTATATSGLAVTITIDASAASVCSIAGSTVSFIGAGTCVIDANQSGNVNYNAAPQAQQSFAVAKGDQTISFTSTAPVGAKNNGPTYTVTATATSGLAVTLTIDATATSVCSIAGSTVSFIGAGTCVIDANQSGNANYNAAPQTQQSFAVAKGDQTITFTSTAPAKVKPGDPAYSVTATATSGLAVTFTIDATSAGICSIAGANVSYIADGTCKIDANQAGNANWNAAPQVQQSILVDAPPTVTSTSPTNGAINVALNSTISITFSKSVNVTGTAFSLACSPGTAPGFTVTPVSPATTYVLHPTSNLPFDSSCTVTVTATQVTTLANTPMAADYTFSFATPPIAVGDSYPETLIGNVSINSAAIPYSVTGNDNFNSPVTITAFDATSANGGTVSMTISGAGIGQFTYNPAAGYTGSDTFTYTISNAHGSSTGTVNLTISGIIWFINNNAGAGDGRLASPFNSLAAFQAVNDGVGNHPKANANIFLYDSATGYTGPVTLLNGQKLIGQDATSSLVTITGLTPGTSSAALPATGGGSPNKVSITSAGNTVTLGSGNTVWGMTLGNATGTALTGASVGSLKIRDLTINTTGAATSLASGALDAILNAVSSGGGTHGISLTTTTGSFDVEGGGASDPANTTRGRTTAKNGGGTLTLGSGGTIQNATSAGVLLSSATNVTLRNMTIQNNGGSGACVGSTQGFCTGGDGITATNGSGLTLDNDLIQGQTTNNGVHANGLAGIAFQHTELTNNASAGATGGFHVWNVRFDSVTGTATIANSLFHNSLENIFGAMENGAGVAMTLNVTNSQFSDTSTVAAGNVGLQIQTDNGANVQLSVNGSTFLRNRSVGVEYLGNQQAGGGSFTVTNSTFDQNASGIGLFHQGAGQTVNFTISNNTLNQTGGLSGAIGVNLGTQSSATTLMQGKILSNMIGNNAIPDSGSNQGSGIGVGAGGAGTLTATVDGNTVVQVDNEGFNAVAAQGTGTLNLTVTNNHFSVDNASPNSDFGAMIVDGGITGDTQTLCLHMAGNTDTGNAATGGTGVALLTEAGTPTFNIQGYGGAANNNSQIASFIDGANTDSPTPALISAGAGTMKPAPANCPTPP